MIEGSSHNEYIIVVPACQSLAKPFVATLSLWTLHRDLLQPLDLNSATKFLDHCNQFLNASLQPVESTR